MLMKAVEYELNSARKLSSEVSVPTLFLSFGDSCMCPLRARKHLLNAGVWFA